MPEKKNKRQENLHAGHRFKLKKRFLAAGLEHFEDHNVLELLLFYAIPRRDTNEIAHRLIARFGSFSKVLDASVEELCSVPGVGEHAAGLIKTYPAVAKRYYQDRFRPGKCLMPYKEMGENLVLHFSGLDHEQVLALFYDNALTFCGQQVIHDGDINSVALSFRTVCNAALTHQAAYVILAHNHPHGVPIASSEDLSTTSQLKNFLLQMNVVLIDHFIVAEGNYSSLQEENYLDLRREFVEKLDRIGTEQ